MKLVYVCSPLKGDCEKNIEKARKYCKEIIEKYPDSIPIAPHIYFTQFLDDEKERDREIGMRVGLGLLDRCRELWVFAKNPSEGMKTEIQHALKMGITVVDGFKMLEDKGVEES